MMRWLRYCQTSCAAGRSSGLLPTRLACMATLPVWRAAGGAAADTAPAHCIGSAQRTAAVAAVAALLLLSPAPPPALAGKNPVFDVPACSDFRPAASGGVKYCDVKVGSGGSPLEGDLVMVDYTARALAAGGARAAARSGARARARPGAGGWSGTASSSRQLTNPGAPGRHQPCRTFQWAHATHTGSAPAPPAAENAPRPRPQAARSLTAARASSSRSGLTP
jgi:hypothetical protein